ncbi:hypothetical protein AB7828_04970 [Tardiphaga sp. 215_C5_N2_1]|uniref:hypothetical protein n=1 Tax=Tardiphaga sp. 215_C5_N2_1 TaxID=3240774 RepID=UPI003F8920A8
MAKISKLEASGRQLDAAIRMFFANEDILAVHTVSRAAFRVLYDITSEGDAKVALKAYLDKRGEVEFNKVTNFLKHADRDPDAEIDDGFDVYTEAAIGMAAGLYYQHAKKLTVEMRAFNIWARMMRPKFFDITPELAKAADEWRAESKIDPDKIEGQKAARDFGALLVNWMKTRKE